MQVIPITINIIVILLSLEKFLSSNPPRKPTTINITPYMNTDFPMQKSKIIPNTNPQMAPTFFPANNPINNKKIIKRFGITSAIVNHVKKLACKKYKHRKTAKNAIIIPTFFNISPLFILLLKLFLVW